MKRILKSPLINAVCISLFTIFYTLVFLIAYENIDFENSVNYENASSLWIMWRDFLFAGHQVYIAYALITVTILVVVLLILRRRPHDEYHTSILTHCLVVAAVLTMIAIAVFYVVILNDPNSIIEKFTLFIVIHWAMVVFANLTYVLLCRR